MIEIEIKETNPGATFTTNLGKLADALATLGAGATAMPVVPALAGVLIDVVDGLGARLSVFDYVVAISVQVDSFFLTAGQVLVDYTKLSKVIKAATKGEARKNWAGQTFTLVTSVSTGVERITTRAGQGMWVGEGPQRAWTTVTEDVVQEKPYTKTEVTVVVAGFELPLEALDVTAYPNLPEAQPATLSVDRGAFFEALQRVGVAAGNDPTLPMYTGVALHLQFDRLNLAATDRYRLAVANLKVNPTASDIKLMVGCGQLTKVVKALPAGKLDLHLPTQSSGWVVLRQGNVLASIRLLEATPPTYLSLFPGQSPATVSVDRIPLTKAVNKAAALASALSYNGRLANVHLTLVDDGIVVTPETNNDGKKARGVKVAAEVDGKLEREGVIGFGSANLLAGLAQFDTVQVALGFSSPSRPVAIAATPSDLSDVDAGYRFLVITLRLP